jgi:hypothetical protein
MTRSSIGSTGREWNSRQTGTTHLTKNQIRWVCSTSGPNGVGVTIENPLSGDSHTPFKSCRTYITREADLHVGANGPARLDGQHGNHRRELMNTDECRLSLERELGRIETHISSQGEELLGPSPLERENARSDQILSI